ncbi:MAG TPA: GNAT family N-acetyltransferase, partial [Blastocatellia bacterium]|nr:GNAT family N-acetyltransferase [Blastocatellia bacterium]
YFTLYALELGDRDVAMQYGLTFNGKFYLLKPAYDETLSQYGLGHLLMLEVLRSSVAQGLKEYDLMSPKSQWKSKWALTERRQSHCFIFRKSLFGQLLYLWKFVVAQRVREMKQHRKASINARVE